MGAIKPISADQKLLYAKVYTVVMGLVCIIIASSLTSVLQVIMLVTKYYIPVLIPVIVFSILKRECHWQSALTSMLVGLISYEIWKHFFNYIFPELFAALILSTLSYLISDYILSNKTANSKLSS